MFTQLRRFSAKSVATPALVKQLRGMTGSGIKDCMKALEENGGDIEASKDYLRKKGLAEADKKVDRLASEGLVGVLKCSETSKITMVQLACETDFVAKTEQFQNSLKGIMETIHSNFENEITSEKCTDQDFLKSLCQDVQMVKSLDKDISSQSIENALKFTISKVSENVQLVKVFQSNWNPNEGEVMQAYIHGQTEKGSGIGKIGSIVNLVREDKKKDEELEKMGQQLALHIAAMKPAYLKESDIPEKVSQDILESEDGKKALKKYIKRDVLFEQELATAEKSMTVGKFLSQSGKKKNTKIEMKDWALFMIQ